MFTQNEMVKKAIEQTYTANCKVFAYEKVLNDDKTTSNSEVLVFDDIKCKLSNKTTNQSYDSNTATSKTKTILLFLSPEYIINAGSKIEVTQNGRTDIYKNSGEASVYPNHQEITLEIFEGWS